MCFPQLAQVIPSPFPLHPAGLPPAGPFILPEIGVSLKRWVTFTRRPVARCCEWTEVAPSPVPAAAERFPR
jgi:hypothetical protein